MNHQKNKQEEEEEKFYSGGGNDEWIKALEPIGTNASKPHLDIAPWLIVVFAQRWGEFERYTGIVQRRLRGKRRFRRAESTIGKAWCDNCDDWECGLRCHTAIDSGR